MNNDNTSNYGDNDDNRNSDNDDNTKNNISNNQIDNQRWRRTWQIFGWIWVNGLDCSLTNQDISKRCVIGLE